MNLRERKRDGCLSQVIRADLPGMGIVTCTLPEPGHKGPSGREAPPGDGLGVGAAKGAVGWASTAFPGSYVASGWGGPPATFF